MAVTRDEAVAVLTAPGSGFEVAPAVVGGIEMRVWARAPSSLRDVLVGTRAYGDRDFLVHGDERWTFAEHLELVAGLAQWLTARGIAKGDRVAIAMRNYPEWIVTFWATQAIGAIAVPLNAWWTGPELRYAIEDSGAALVVADGERWIRLAADLAELGVPAVVVRASAEEAAGIDGVAAVPWSALDAELDRSAPLADVPIEPDDDATIVYTSGTTGVPKGAVSTHRNHVTTYLNTAFAHALGATLAKAARPPEQRERRRPSFPPCSLMTYPFFHIGGLNTLYLSTGFGVKVVLQFKWDLEEALGLIERERITTLAVVPTLLRQVLESPLLQEHDVSSLGTLSSGGAPVPPDLVERIDRDFADAAPSNGYGLTETTGAATLNAGREYVEHATSVGRTFPVTDVRVVDPETGADAAEGGVGELWFRGPSVARGYWNKPDATAQSFTDGWFHTGDLGFVDGDGFVSVVDRLKDVIIRGGENVYCAEVEATLVTHPGVADAAVVGVPHHELGEEVAAVVVAVDGHEPDVDDLRAHVAARLAYFKVPAHVLVRREDLPRNATGKVLKRELRDEVGARLAPKR